MNELLERNTRTYKNYNKITAYFKKVAFKDIYETISIYHSLETIKNQVRINYYKKQQ